MRETGWNWKDAGGDDGGLRYEPGNWGDLLKAAWALRVAGWLAADAENFAYRDVFAGAPEYPLCARSAARLRRCGDAELQNLTRADASSGRWPSAAVVAWRVVSEPARKDFAVYDTDPARLERWRGLAGAQTLSLASGWEFFPQAQALPASGLLLLDPYDFLAEWREHAEAFFAAAAATTTLVYVYNRSARGKERLRDYREFRRALERVGAGETVVGRVPADGFLPDAHHEMLLLAPERIARRAGFEALRKKLESCTLTLARAAEAGEFLDY